MFKIVDRNMEQHNNKRPISTVTIAIIIYNKKIGLVITVFFSVLWKRFCTVLKRSLTIDWTPVHWVH